MCGRREVEANEKGPREAGRVLQAGEARRHAKRGGAAQLSSFPVLSRMRKALRMLKMRPWKNPRLCFADVDAGRGSAAAGGHFATRGAQFLDRLVEFRAAFLEMAQLRQHHFLIENEIVILFIA